MSFSSLEELDIDAWVVLIVGFAFLALRLVRARPSRGDLPLPPGPKPLPIIGNVLDMPRKLLAPEFFKLNERYGDLVYLNALGQSMVLLGSYEAARELLDKRSSNYSSRPQNIMKSLIGGDWAFVFDHNDQVWRQRRKTFHHHFGPKPVAKYESLQEEATERLLRDLVAKPESFIDHLRFMFGATILRVVYGITATGRDDEILALEEEAIIVCDKAYTPGKYLVEVFPFLRHVPAWMPGAGFKRDAAQWNVLLQATRNRPFDITVENMRRGDAPPSVVSSILEGADGKGGISLQEESIARDVTGMAYFAAVDTVQSTSVTFFCVMAMFPDVQKKAQAELDAVVGLNRLPRFSDRDSLPYLNALLYECLRWRPVAQFGLPHRATADDEFNGYKIPAGTVFLSNVWAMAHDPKHYPDPNRFMPERFLTADGRPNESILHPREYVFGFGRRICPGSQFGESNLFITFATILHALNIEFQPQLDERGRPRVPTRENVQMRENFLTYPVGLSYKFKPRSSFAEALVSRDHENQ